VTSLHNVQCPYCGETFETEIDASGGSQEYVEDCYVCCKPIVFRIEVGPNGELTSIEAEREND
jgi:Cysteine-rich CPXCG